MVWLYVRRCSNSPPSIPIPGIPPIYMPPKPEISTYVHARLDAHTYISFDKNDAAASLVSAANVVTEDPSRKQCVESRYEVTQHEYAWLQGDTAAARAYSFPDHKAPNITHFSSSFRQCLKTKTDAPKFIQKYIYVHVHTYECKPTHEKGACSHLHHVTISYINTCETLSSSSTYCASFLCP